MSYLIPSTSTLYNDCSHQHHPNILSLPFLITKLTGSNPQTVLSFAFFFPSKKIHPTLPHALLSSAMRCSVLTRILSQLIKSNYPLNVIHALLTVAVTDKLHPPFASNTLSTNNKTSNDTQYQYHPAHHC